MAAKMLGRMQPTIYRFSFGDFEVVCILDSDAIREPLHPTFGGNQPADAAHALARANRIDANRFQHPFIPTLVNTGKELVLFDTGNGNLRNEFEQLKARLPEGHLVARLAEAGYKPEDVDIVVTTHGHPDHIGALTTNGKTVFPKARYVFGAAEFNFWKRGENIPEARKFNRELFVKIAIPFGEKATFIKPGDELVPGIHAVDASGHSAGLMAYHVESQGKRLLIAADTFSHYVISMQRPDWTFAMDDDKDKAIATRKRILDMAATEQLWVHGFHMPFPGFGYIEKGQEGFRWMPVSYQLNL